MRLNCIMKRSSSLRASRGFLSLSYCRRSLISASVGKNRIKHSTKSTRIVRRSKLQKHKATCTFTQYRPPFRSCFAVFSRVYSYCSISCGIAFAINLVITLVILRGSITVVIPQVISEVNPCAVKMYRLSHQLSTFP